MRAGDVVGAVVCGGCGVVGVVGVVVAVVARTLPQLLQMPPPPPPPDMVCELLGPHRVVAGTVKHSNVRAG